MEQRESALESLGLGSSFWKNKKVFLTGHTGFKGGWTALWLSSLGAKVFGYSLAPNTKPNFFEEARVESFVDSVIADVRDLETLAKRMKEVSPDIVIHMAAQPLVRDSYDDPVKTYSTNIMGTVNLFEAVRKTPSVRVVLNVTTDKCYLNVSKNEGYIETDPLGGYDPYSSSKACSELVTSSYRNSFFNLKDFKTHRVAVASARAGNVIGGGDWSKDRLIPDLIRAAANGEAAIIRQPKAVRPWQHVLEPVHGYLLLCEKMWDDGEKYSQEYNFGPDEGDAKDVHWITRQIVSAWGHGASFEVVESATKHEAQILKLNCEKAKSILGWLPKLVTEQAIDMTTTWYKKFYIENADMKEISLRQISDYLGNRLQ